MNWTTSPILGWGTCIRLGVGAKPVVSCYMLLSSLFRAIGHFGSFWGILNFKDKPNISQYHIHGGYAMRFTKNLPSVTWSLPIPSIPEKETKKPPLHSENHSCSHRHGLGKGEPLSIFELWLGLWKRRINFIYFWRVHRAGGLIESDIKTASSKLEFGKPLRLFAICCHAEISFFSVTCRGQGKTY